MLINDSLRLINERGTLINERGTVINEKRISKTIVLENVVSRRSLKCGTPHDGHIIRHLWRPVSHHSDQTYRDALRHRLLKAKQDTVSKLSWLLLNLRS